MANPPLYLTKEEQKVFEKLPEVLRAGVRIEEEKIMFTETSEGLEVRMRNMKIEHPVLKKLREESKSKKQTSEDIAKIAESIDLSNLSKNDLIELAFAWGPTMFTHMISLALPAVASPEELIDVGNLAGMRHGLLLSLA